MSYYKEHSKDNFFTCISSKHLKYTTSESQERYDHLCLSQDILNEYSEGFWEVSKIGIILLISCHAKEKPLPPVELSSARKTEVIQSVVSWLEYEECDEGELDRLKNEGNYAIPTLAAALNDGPSPSSIELMRLQMEKRYDRLIEYAKTHPEARIQESKKDFVSHYLNNYEALYRIRAVQGLSAIGGEDAYKAIQNASRRSYREDVNVVIKEALKAEKKYINSFEKIIYPLIYYGLPKKTTS